MSTQHPEEWNPLDPAVLQAQGETYDRLRERCPVAHSTLMGWSLFRHADITSVLADSKTFSNASPFPAIPNGMDPPEHGEFRSALDCHFSPAAITRYEPSVRRIAVEQLNPLLASGSADFMTAFAAPFMMKSQCAMLGWPEEQWQQLFDWTEGNAAAALHQDQEAGKVLAEEFAAMVGGNLERERRLIGGLDNATTVLLSTAVNGKRLADEQIVTLLRNWIAGQGTTITALGIIAELLALDSALQNNLRKNPELIGNAVEEILRWRGPLVANKRTATADVTIAGNSVAAGDKLSLMWIAANRDANVFVDPDTVDISRDTTQSLVWGQGIHVCQGAPLARLELRVAIEEVLARTREFTLAGGQSERAVYPANGPAALPLRFAGEAVGLRRS